jgi:LmbE family N-acetylglucosaminyl deacetylase
MTREKLRDMRYAEQREAAKVLGVKHVVFLGYEDGYLYPTLEVRKDVARQVRIHKPDVILAMDPRFRVADEGYINHPDHIAAGEVALRTINPDASTRQMFPSSGATRSSNRTSRRRCSSRRSATAAPSSTSATPWRPRSGLFYCIVHSSDRRLRDSCAIGTSARASPLATSSASPSK